MKNWQLRFIKTIGQLSALILAMGLLFPLPSAARTFSNQPIGKIINFQGSVHIVRNGERFPAKPGTLLRVSDQLESQEREAMEVVFFGVGRVKIGRNSAVQIKTIAPSETGLQTRVTMELLFGTAMFSIGENDVQIKTPTADIRARNKAEFFVRHNDGKTEVFCVADTVSVHNVQLGVGGGVDLAAGRTTSVADGQAPGAPTRFPAETIVALKTVTDPNASGGGRASTGSTGAAGLNTPLGYTPPGETGPSIRASGTGAQVTIGGGGGGANPSSSAP